MIILGTCYSQFRQYFSADESSLNNAENVLDSTPSTVHNDRDIPVTHNLCYAAQFRGAHNRRISL